MKKLLSASVLFVLFAGIAQASEQVVVSCRGSILPDMSISENYTLSLTDMGDIVVAGQYKDSRGLFMAIGPNDVIKNDQEGLTLMSAKKRLGMVYAKQSIEIDYKTGKGKVSDYQMLESALKPKMIYLDLCERR